MRLAYIMTTLHAPPRFCRVVPNIALSGYRFTMKYFRYSFPIPILFLLLLSTLGSVVATVGKHKSNYAVIVSTSRYWFNYRHNA